MSATFVDAREIVSGEAASLAAQNGGQACHSDVATVGLEAVMRYAGREEKLKK